MQFNVQSAIKWTWRRAFWHTEANDCDNCVVHRVQWKTEYFSKSKRYFPKTPSSHPQKCYKLSICSVTRPFLSPRGVACETSPMCRASLITRPHPLTRKRVWWLLSAFLVVPSQQSWFLNKWMLYLYDVALFHWLVQNRYCWLGTTKKVLQWSPVVLQSQTLTLNGKSSHFVNSHLIQFPFGECWQSGNRKSPLFMWESGSVRLQLARK